MPSANVKSELQAILNPADPKDVGNAFRAIGQLLGIDRRRALITFGAEAGDDRDCTIRVVDRVDRPVPGRCVVLVWVSDTEYGAPGGSHTIGALAEGVQLAELTADDLLVLLTNADGKIEAPITLAGAGTVYVHAVLWGQAEVSVGSASFTA